MNIRCKSAQNGVAANVAPSSVSRGWACICVMLRSMFVVLYISSFIWECCSSLKFCMLQWWLTRSFQLPFYPLVVETCSTAQPVPSFCPSAEHEMLPQPVQRSYLYSPPTPLAIHLQHWQTEECFRTHQAACTNSVAFVLTLSNPAVGSEDLCTAHWASTSSTGETGDRLVVWSWYLYICSVYLQWVCNEYLWAGVLVITILTELTAQKGKGDRGKRTSDRAWTWDLRSIAEFQPCEPWRLVEILNSSPIALMYWSQVCRYPATLKTCALRLVMCAMWWWQAQWCLARYMSSRAWDGKLLLSLCMCNDSSVSMAFVAETLR